jgi:hypothetical protein
MLKGIVVAGAGIVASLLINEANSESRSSSASHSESQERNQDSALKQDTP